MPERIVDIRTHRLASTTCGTDPRPNVLRRQLHSAVAVGPVTQIQWLWQSDFYYVNAAGKVTRNYDIVDTTIDWTDSAEAIDVPPNSTFDVRVDITVPADSVAIGHRADVGQDSQHVEWTLPTGWQNGWQCCAPPGPSTPSSSRGACPFCGRSATRRTRVSAPKPTKKGASWHSIPAPIPS